MTDEQINAAIAEACGRKRRPDGDWYPDNGSAGTQAILNYCTDLNAMHEAEKILTCYNKIHTYVWHLENRDDWHTDLKLMATHATARQRAEAFLRTLGKWEDGK
jgi:hypothetical protein